MRGRNVVHTLINWLPGSILYSFDDLEDAVTWLQHLRPNRPPKTTPARSAATQAQLEQELHRLREKTACSRREPACRRRHEQVTG